MSARPWHTSISRRDMLRVSSLSSVALATQMIFPASMSLGLTPPKGPVFNVLDFGAVGNGITDDTTALSAAANAARSGGEIFFPAGRTYRVTGSMDLSHIQAPVTVNVPQGAVIVQYSDVAVINASGALGNGQPSSNVQAGDTSFSVTGPPMFSVGSFVYICSKDTIPGSTDKLAYIRSVSSISGSTVGVDRRLPRPMNATLTRPVRFLPQIQIIGGGQIRHADGSNFRPLINLTLCFGPVVSVELGPSGGPGVTLAHCFGGRFDGYVHDLSDNTTTGHYGYGVNAAGATRNLRVGGRGARCRHAFTTNVGPNIPNSAYYGEPEDVYVDMVTEGCTNKALDTHRAGWGITFLVNDTGSTGGGVQIRADNTTVAGGVISGARCYGVGVSALVRVPAQINDITINNLKGLPGRGLELLGPAMVRRPKLTGFTSVGIRVSAPGCAIGDANIDGLTGALALVGIDVLASKTTIRGGSISGVGTGIRVASGLEGCTWKRLTFGPSTMTKVQAV